jgi:hypothetical protein
MAVRCVKRMTTDDRCAGLRGPALFFAVSLVRRDLAFFVLGGTKAPKARRATT